MKIDLHLKNIIVRQQKTNKKVFLKVKIGDDIEFNSSDVMMQHKTYSFLETNSIEVQDQLIDYVAFQLISSKKIIAHKTIFLNQALNNNTVELNPVQENKTFKLQYKLEILHDQSIMIPTMKRKTTIKDQPQHLSNDEGKLQILKMGVLMYNFAQRLDPTVKVYRILKMIFCWEKPLITTLFGCLLSFMVIYPKLSLLIFSLFLMFGKHKIMKKLQQFQIQQDVSKRIFLPEENAVFLQNNMQRYCDLFELINNFLRDEDRTQIVSLVKNICKLGFLLIIVLLIFPLQVFLIGAIWTLLILSSPQREKVFSIFMPRIAQLNSMVDKATNKFSQSRIAKMISFNDIKKYKIVKELYIYEYQRWWVGKEWVQSHWSDENRQLVLLARKQPPKNWKWANEWKIAFEENKDEDGFQYTNDLFVGYTPSKSLKTIRRRKWIRKCTLDLDRTYKKKTTLQTEHSKIQ